MNLFFFLNYFLRVLFVFHSVGRRLPVRAVVIGLSKLLHYEKTPNRTKGQRLVSTILTAVPVACPPNGHQFTRQ